MKLSHFFTFFNLMFLN